MVGIAAALRGLRGRRFTLFAFLLGGSLLIPAVPIRPGVVLGESMSPFFQSGQVFLMSRVRDTSALHLGDVVVVDVEGDLYLKRIYATEGQVVWGIDWAEVDGSPDAVVAPTEIDTMRRLAQERSQVGRVVDISVPPGHVFLLGDREENSRDSRHFGPVPIDAIRGRVVMARLLRLWGQDHSGHSVFMASEAASAPGHQEREAGRPGGRGRPVRGTESHPTPARLFHRKLLRSSPSFRPLRPLVRRFPGTGPSATARRSNVLGLPPNPDCRTSAASHTGRKGRAWRGNARPFPPTDS